MGRYAVHCAGVAFSCKRHGESVQGISTPSNANTHETIRQIYGNAVAKELFEFEISDQKLGFKAIGWASNANYHVKKTTILLFINHRLVESTAIKRAIEQTYSSFLPKGGHPFEYLSLEIDPQRVDVNVHPTKREVNFLNEDEIIEVICTAIGTKLAQVDTSRTFTTQALLPGARVPVAAKSGTQLVQSGTTQRSPFTPQTKPYENNLVRTDPNLRKITSMLTSSNRKTNTRTQTQPVYQSSPRERTECRLSTIKTLRAAVRDAVHAQLTELFACHTYVGLVSASRRIVAIQGGVNLYLVDYGMIANEFFYQLGLADFGNFGAITFVNPLNIEELIAIAVKEEQARKSPDNEGIVWDDVPAMVTRQLVDRRAMLREYFQLNVNEKGELLSIPLLLKGYSPCWGKLPRFLMHLGPCVDWDDESNCFHTFLQELAAFYTPEQLPHMLPQCKDHSSEMASEAAQGADSDGELLYGRRQEMEFVLEHVLFPALRARLVATKGLLSGIEEVANLKGLYRVFERC